MSGGRYRDYITWVTQSAAVLACRAHFVPVIPHPQRCRSCLVCSGSALPAPPRSMTAVRSTVRRATATESGCTAANGSGHSCSCRAQKEDHFKQGLDCSWGICNLKQFHNTLPTLGASLTNAMNLSDLNLWWLSNEWHQHYRLFTWSKSCWTGQHSEKFGHIYESKKSVSIHATSFFKIVCQCHGIINTDNQNYVKWN